MERIGIYDARARLPELIERVQSGEELHARFKACA